MEFNNAPVPLSSEQILNRDIGAALAAKEAGKLLHRDGRIAANWPAYIASIARIDPILRDGKGRCCVNIGAFPWVVYLRPEELARLCSEAIGEQMTIEAIRLLDGEGMRAAALEGIGKLKVDSQRRILRPSMPTTAEEKKQKEPVKLRLLVEDPALFQEELKQMRAKSGLKEFFDDESV